MGDLPFDRVLWGLRERHTSDDKNRHMSQLARTLQFLAGRMFGARATDDSEARSLRDAFHGPDFAVNASNPAAMTVVVANGLGWQYLASDVATDLDTPDHTSVDDRDTYKPIVLMEPATFVVPTAPVGPNQRWDIIEVRANRSLVDSETRRQLNPATGNYDPHDFYKTLSYAVDGLVDTVNAPADSTEPLSYKVGVAGVGPSVPSTSPGYVKLAEIFVDSGVATIAQTDIVDRRRLIGEGGVVRSAVRFGISWNAGAPFASIAGTFLPPGVRYTVIPVAGTRGRGRLYIAAGEITRCSVRAILRGTSAILGATELIGTVATPVILPGDYLQTVDAALQTALAGGLPALEVGIGTKVVGVQVEGRYLITGGTINSMNAFLEEVTVDAEVDVAYTP